MGRSPGHPWEIAFHGWGIVFSGLSKSPWLKGTKLMTNSLSLGESMESSTTWYLLLVVKKDITTFFNLFLLNQSIIFTLISLAKQTNKGIQFFLPAFCSFSHIDQLILVPGKALACWTTSNKSCGYYPCGPVKLFPKINNFPPRGKKEIPKLFHSPWVPVGSPRVPAGRLTGKQMISAL